MQRSTIVNGNQSAVHPILSAPEHPIIEFFKTLIDKQYSLTQTDSNLTQLLNKLIFETQELTKVKEKYQNLSVSFDNVCNKIIPKKTVYYCCLDCDKVSKEENSLVALMCQSCFMRSNHQGHRIVMNKNKYNQSICYCGDSTIFDQAGFCTSHAKKAIKFESVRDKLGADFTDNFIKNLKIAFYGIVSMLELFEKNRDSPKRFVIREVVTILFEQVLDFCNICVNELNSIFLLVISQVFMDKFLTDYSKLLHSCNDFKGKKGFSSETNCSCSINESLLRFIATIDFSFQFLYLIKNLAKDYDFRQAMAISYMKYLHFIFLNDDPKKRTLTASHAKFATLSNDLFTNNEICEQAVKSAYTINIFEILQDTLLKCTSFQGRFLSLISELKNVFQLVMRPGSIACKLLLKNNYTLIVLIESLSGFREAHYYNSLLSLRISENDVNFNFINDSLECEALVLSLARRAITQLDELDDKDKETSFTKVCMYWKERFEQFIRKERKKNVYSFHPVLERLLPHLIRQNNFDVDKNMTLNFIKNRLGNKPEAIAGYVVEGLVKPLGAIKLISNLSSSALTRISSIYHNISYNLFDNDILNIQMMAMILPKTTNMYEFLVKHFFYYSKEISEFLLEFKHLTNEDIQSFGGLIQDFFHFLLYLMTDETCLANNVFTRDPSSYIEMHITNERIKKIVKRVIINILSCYTWIDLSDLQEKLREILNVTNLDEILGEVAIFDEKIKKMRIKEEFFQDYDPYLFYGRKKLQEQLKELFIEKMKKSSTVDLYSGFYYTDLSENLYDLQQSIIQGTLLTFISKLIMFNKQEYKPLMRITLKMLLFALNTAEHQYNRGVDCSQFLFQIKDHFQNSYMLSKFHSFKEDGLMKDCELILDNILESLTRLKEIEEQNLTTKVEKPEKPLYSVTEKKMLSEKKSKEKQELFTRKSMGMFKRVGMSLIKDYDEEEEEDNFKCCVCQQIIKTEEEIYGVPIYITMTNQVGDNFMKDTKDSCYPYVRTCLHHFHQTCFLEKAPQHNSEDPGFDFLKECFCPVCDSFSNFFMPMNKIADKEGDTEEITAPHNVISILGTLSESISGLNADKISETSTDSESGNKHVALDSVINSFQYFIETMNNDLKYEHFVREIEIYIAFLKGVRIHFGENGSYEVMAFKAHKKKLNAEKKLYCSAVQKIIISSQTDKYFLEKAKRLLNDYIRDKAIERITLNASDKIFNKTSMLYKIYDNALEVSFKTPQLQEELLYVLKKVAYIYAIGLGQTQDVKSEKMQAILKTLHDESKCTIKDLLALFEVKKRAEDYFKDVLFDSEFGEENLEFPVCTPLNEKPLLFNIYAVNTSIIDLPKSYLDFTQKYFKSLCVKCKSLPLTGDTAVCLLCGEVFCLKKCLQKESSEDSITLSLEGNLFKHRKYHHAGNGLFCEISNLKIILIYSSRVFVTKAKPLYTDSINQNIMSIISNPSERSLHDVDFRRFYLNKDTISYLQQMITKHRLPHEQLELSRTNNGVFGTKDI